MYFFYLKTSAVDSHLLDDKKIEDSISKRDFIKIYWQSGADVSNEISNIKFFFVENHKVSSSW